MSASTLRLFLGFAALATLLPAVAQPASERDFRVPSNECLGFVLDAQQGLRPGDQILVDGRAVLVPDAGGRLAVDRDRLLPACRADGTLVQIVVLRAERIASIAPR
jgi:hypothetical protein